MRHSKTCASLLALLFFSCSALFAQKPPAKFGKIETADLALADCAFEPGAAALVLFDYAEYELTLRTGRGFALEMQRHKRVKIFSKNGLDEANVSLPFYAGKTGHFEEIKDVKAKCHFLENGAVKTLDLSSKDVFEHDLGLGRREVKFAIPGALEGCVIEYQYTLLSHDLENMESWQFQGGIPVQHSEIWVTMPEFLVFQHVQRGMLNLDVNKSSQVQRRYMGHYQGRSINFEETCNAWQWAMREVPSIRLEPNMGPVSNLVAHMEFQLLYLQFETGEREEIMSSYEKFNSNLLADTDFGGIAKPGGFEKKLVGEIAGSVESPEAKAAAILKHLQEKVKWDEYHGIYASKPPAKVYEAGTGSLGDINLMLVACLRAAGLKADPLILATRNHARLHPIYPNRRRFNYVAAVVEIGGKNLFADASVKGLPLGFLPEKCLNGEGWVVRADAPGFIPVQATATGSTTKYLELAHDGTAWTGKFRIKSTGYAAIEALQNLQTAGQVNYLKSLQEGLADWNPGEAQLTLSDAPFTCLVEIPVSLEAEDETLVYLKPPFANPAASKFFQAETRAWPVDFPYAANFNYVFSLTLPEGWTATEKPADALTTLGDNRDLVFQYRCSEDGNRVMINSKLGVKNLFFLPEEYGDLRLFYNMLEQKNGEILVLKKD